MANMTATTAATWLPEVWSKIATVTYRSNTPLRALMDHRWEALLRSGGGDTVNIPAFSQNSGAVARSTFGTAAGLSSELIATTESQVQLVVNKMAIYGYSLPVEMRVQVMPSYLTHLSEGIGTSLGLYLDAQLGSDNSNGLDGFTSNVVGTDNVDITEDDIITCRVNLDNANADINDRFMPVSPASMASLHKIEVFRNSLNKAAVGGIDANKGRGMVGHIHSFDVYETNNLEAGTSGKKNAAFQREAIAIAVQQDAVIKKEESVVDGFIEYVSGYIIFGQKMVKETFGNELDGK